MTTTTTITLNGQTIDVDSLDALENPYKWAFCELYAHIAAKADEYKHKADKAWDAWFEDKTTVNMSKFLQIDSNAAEMGYLLSYMEGLTGGLVDPNE